jgi:hypothetical protein
VHCLERVLLAVQLLDLGHKGIGVEAGGRLEFQAGLRNAVLERSQSSRSRQEDFASDVIRFRMPC